MKSNQMRYENSDEIDEKKPNIDFYKFRYNIKQVPLQPDLLSPVKHFVCISCHHSLVLTSFTMVIITQKEIVLSIISPIDLIN